MFESQWMALVPAPLIASVGPAMAADGFAALPIVRQAAAEILALPTAPTERLRDFDRALRQLGLQLEKLADAAEAGDELDEDAFTVAMQRFAGEAETLARYIWSGRQRPAGWEGLSR